MEPYALADRVVKEYVGRAKTMKSLALAITITTLVALSLYFVVDASDKSNSVAAHSANRADNARQQRLPAPGSSGQSIACLSSDCSSSPMTARGGCFSPNLTGTWARARDVP